MNWLFDMFGDWVEGFIVKGFEDLANGIIDIVLGLVDGFWEDKLVNAFLNFSVSVNAIVTVIAVLILCFDIAEENKPIIWRQVFANLLKGGLFAIFSRYIGLMTLELSNLVASKISIKFDSSSFMDALNGLVPSSGIATRLIWILIIIIAFAAFGVLCVIRNASMLVMILSSSLYIPDVIRGDTAKMGDWIRQVIAISITFVFQYILFNVGLSGVVSSNFVLLLTGFAGMFVVPQLLQKFGYSSGVTGILSGAGNMVMQAGYIFAK